MVEQVPSRAELGHFLTGKFSLSELKSLAFDVGVDYEMLSYQNKADLAIELIYYCERHELLDDLVHAAVRERPGTALAQGQVTPLSRPERK